MLVLVDGSFPIFWFVGCLSARWQSTQQEITLFTDCFPPRMKYFCFSVKNVCTFEACMFLQCSCLISALTFSSLLLGSTIGYLVSYDKCWAPSKRLPARSKLFSSMNGDRLVTGDVFVFNSVVALGLITLSFISVSISLEKCLFCTALNSKRSASVRSSTDTATFFWAGAARPFLLLVFC